MTAWHHILALVLAATAPTTSAPAAAAPNNVPPVAAAPALQAPTTSPTAAPSGAANAAGPKAAEPPSVPGPGAPEIPDAAWKPFVIPAGQEASVTRLLEPYWSHPQSGVSITGANVDKTFVQVGVKLGNATSTLYLVSSEDHATQVGPEAKSIAANDAMTILARCAECTDEETRTLKTMAQAVLTNQQQNKTQLWKAIPRPRNAGNYRAPWPSRMLGWILVFLAVVAGIGLRMISRRQARSSVQPNTPSTDKPAGNGTN